LPFGKDAEMTDKAKRNTRTFTWRNPPMPGKREGSRALVERYPESSNYEPGRIVIEGDLVVAHGRYLGGDKTLIAADIFRFEGDFIVEHWDVLQEEVAAEKTVAANPRVGKP